MDNHVFAGIDVSAKTLDVCVEVDGHKRPVRQFENSPAGQDKVRALLTKGGRKVRVVVEATGAYSLPLSLALHKTEGVELMVANPRAVKDFTRACMQRSKSDVKDSESICEFAKRMPFTAWTPPSTEVLELQAISRRLIALTVDSTREKNRLHAIEARNGSKFVINDINVNIRHLERRIDQMGKQALALIRSHTELQTAFQHVTSIKGIAQCSAISILGELLALPKDMTVREWVAHAGLDPRDFTSGTSVHRPVRISKVGNVNLRRALYMPALVAVSHEPHIKAFYEKRLSGGLDPLPALVAVMRKLLHSIHGMLRHDADFDGQKFFAIPSTPSAPAPAPSLLSAPEALV